MANICSIDLTVEFETQKKSTDFAEAFGDRIKEADERGEGVRIAKDE